jgi:hypothetical protein
MQFSRYLIADFRAFQLDAKGVVLPTSINRGTRNLVNCGVDERAALSRKST